MGTPSAFSFAVELPWDVRAKNTQPRLFTFTARIRDSDATIRSLIKENPFLVRASDPVDQVQFKKTCNEFFLRPGKASRDGRTATHLQMTCLP
jgi:hypothetical protein